MIVINVEYKGTTTNEVMLRVLKLPLTFDVVTMQHYSFYSEFGQENHFPF